LSLKGNSVLDHLISHISGDAFTTSNLNSPNHPINKFLSDPVITNVDPEPETYYNIPSPPQQKSPEVVFHSSPIHLDVPEQETHHSITISELDKQISLQTSIPEQPIHNVEITPEPQIPQLEQT
jgi:hypothetical protein